MTITRETLELAARAAGIELIKTKDGYPLYSEAIGVWSPLTDHGQLLDLAMACKISIDPLNNEIGVLGKPEEHCRNWRNVNCQHFPTLAEVVIFAAAEQQLAKDKP